MKYFIYILMVILTLPSILLVPVIMFDKSFASQLLNQSVFMESILARNTFTMILLDFLIIINIIISSKIIKKGIWGYSYFKIAILVYTIIGLFRIIGDFLSFIIIKGLGEINLN